MFPLLAHEVKYYFKNKSEVIYLYSYFISIVLLVPFAGSGNETSKLQELAPLTLWIALASAIALGASSLFKRENEQGRLEYLQLMPIALEWVVFSKWLAFYGFVLAPMLAALPVAGLLFNLSAGELWRDAIGLGAGAAALSVLSALVSAITSGMEKAGAVLSLIILPLTIPVMIFGAAYCRDSGAIWQPNLLFLIGFSVFLLPILCLAGAYSIRASN